MREFVLSDQMGHFQVIITLNRYADLIVYVLALEETPLQIFCEEPS